MDQQAINDAIEPLVETFCEKMAAVLTMSLGSEFILSVNKSFPIEDFLLECPWNEFVSTEAEFGGDISGQIYFFINPAYGAKLADLMVMGDGEVEFDEEEHIDALKELSDQTFGGFVTDIGAKFEKQISIENSNALLMSKLDLPDPTYYCSEISVNEDESKVYLVYSEEIINHFMGTGSSPDAQAVAGDGSEWDKIVENPNLRQILTTDLDISIIYGSAELPISEILNMEPNTILELDKHANEPVDIYVNGKIFAKGEIVVVNKSYGIVIKKIVSVKERILSLRD